MNSEASHKFIGSALYRLSLKSFLNTNFSLESKASVYIYTTDWTAFPAGLYSEPPPNIDFRYAPEYIAESLVRSLFSYAMFALNAYNLPSVHVEFCDVVKYTRFNRFHEVVDRLVNV